MKPSTAPRPEEPVGLPDLRQVPLAQVPALGDRVLDDMLLRVAPEPPANRVGVAAFNSSI